MQKFISRQRLLLAAMLLYALTGNAIAHEDGPPPGHTGGFGEPDCTACHFDNAANTRGGSLTIEGLTATFVADTRYLLTITIKRRGLQNGGFQLTVRDLDGKPAGELHAIEDGVQTIAVDATGQTYAQHSVPGVPTEAGNAISWTAVWEAPTDIDEVIIDVAANAANDDSSALGDFVHTLTKRLAASGASPSTQPYRVSEKSERRVGDRSCRSE